MRDEITELTNHRAAVRIPDNRTVERVAAIIETDANLTDRQKAALSDLFGAAYKKLAESGVD